MATSFPASLDALTNPTSGDSLSSPSHSGQHADANDAIEALQAKVGVNSSAVTTSLDYKVAQAVTLTGVQTVTDKVLASAVLKSPEERWNLIGGSGPTGAQNIDAETSTAWQWTYDSTGNTTFNFRWNSGTTLDSKLDYGDSITFVVSMLNGATAYYPTAFSIDGTSVTPKWQGGAAPAAGNASSRDIYVFTLVKGYIGWDVYASQTQFA